MSLFARFRFCQIFTVTDRQELLRLAVLWCLAGAAVRLRCVPPAARTAAARGMQMRTAAVP
jgi:hypothetical protein